MDALAPMVLLERMEVQVLQADLAELDKMVRLELLVLTATTPITVVMVVLAKTELMDCQELLVKQAKTEKLALLVVQD